MCAREDGLVVIGKGMGMFGLNWLTRRSKTFLLGDECNGTERSFWLLYEGN